MSKREIREKQMRDFCVYLLHERQDSGDQWVEEKVKKLSPDIHLLALVNKETYRPPLGFEHQPYLPCLTKSNTLFSHQGCCLSITVNEIPPLFDLLLISSYI